MTIKVFLVMNKEAHTAPITDDVVFAMNRANSCNGRSIGQYANTTGRVTAKNKPDWLGLPENPIGTSLLASFRELNSGSSPKVCKITSKHCNAQRTTTAFNMLL